MVRYFFGEDQWAARQELDNIATAKSAVIRFVNKEDIDADSISMWYHNRSQQLFGQELIVIQDVSFLPKGIQEDLLEVIEGVNDDLIYWDRKMPDKRSKLFKKLIQSSKEFKTLPQNQLVDWLEGEAKKSDAILERDAAKLLIERAGTDRWKLLSELGRILLIETNVTRDIVFREIVAVDHVEDIFSLLESLTKNEKGLVFRKVEKLLSEGNSEFYILSMLAYQYKTLFVVREGVDRGWADDEISRANKLSLFVVRKSNLIAKARPATYWRIQLTRVLALDVAIRQGKVGAKTGLLMLLNGLL